MGENHWFAIGFLFCAGFAAAWVLRSQRPLGNRLASALVVTSVAVMQIPELVMLQPAERRMTIWVAGAIILVAVGVSSTMGRRHRSAAG
jgi:hypothetical protein